MVGSSNQFNMAKLLLVFLIICSFPELSFCQESGSTRYKVINSSFEPMLFAEGAPVLEHKSDLLTVELSSDKFYLIYHEPFDAPWYATDTLAICDVKRISEEFYMISSEQPESILQRSMKVSSERGEVPADSLEVVLDLPVEWIHLNVSIYLDDTLGEDMRLRYEKTPTSFMIPRSTRKISLGFEPEISSIVHEHPHLHTFQGVLLTYPTVCCEISPGTDLLRIEIPALCPAFFERYHVQDEYIRVTGDTLSWRGMKFMY